MTETIDGNGSCAIEIASFAATIPYTNFLIKQNPARFYLQAMIDAYFEGKIQ